MNRNNFLIGVFNDDAVLIDAVTKVREAGIRIHECYTPFPVHGLGDAMGYKRSKLPIAAFLFGMLGTSLALLMQFYMLGIDWPMIIGGKNYTSIPTFFPVTFELTVLLSALGMVGTFMIISDLRPYGKAKVFDLRATDDKFIMAIDMSKNNIALDEIKRTLTSAGAVEVNEKHN
uniref:DUF3341 domain-containing protein n=1 Tax=Roseihalotalea indica TaxID=2867963 RepID=A0AA49GT29_9BACT|nr:DUF3341 domain-containing protein [Tunicatimonas sp. TK19036]